MKKKILDVIMTTLLLFLMAYQVTGEMLHEWIGIGMTVIVIIHHILNRKWYSSLFKGKYNAYRILTASSVLLLFAAFFLTAFCGMAMSGHAVPFLYGMADISFARRFHLAMSHWAFVLLGLHLGLHIPAMLSKWKLNEKIRIGLTILSCLIGGYGLFVFLRNNIPGYMFFKVLFAFFDYGKAKVLVILENLAVLVFWTFIGTQLANLCLSKAKKRNPLFAVLFMILSIGIGIAFVRIFPTI